MQTERTDKESSPRAEQDREPDPVSHPELVALAELMRDFRGEHGCAWHEQQTHESLVPYLTEESAEVIDAIETGTPADLREELGDLLFQVLFHSDIAEAAGEFTLEDVAREQAAKLRHRNPHVFGDTPTRDVDEIIRLWHERKAEQKRHRTSVLDGISHAMPALALAAKVLGRAEELGMDVSPEQLAALAVGEEEQEDKFGGSLLATVSAARAAAFDSERALRGAVRRLEYRIREHEAGTSREQS
ncbi:MazG family protein [Gulosibacter molinativorax]|uniref:Nucleoside triphosphate pyrophosphohydrolase n=1 Tax=Gulosibacter molinativorax TaxID=256821 RepID=A0ABT7C6K0_9MICO|nr:MazG family protein [Gulosibacter molinativorax]MDJ1370820.1 nucleoside triphosphate pyrophosphohydrolase [Gulosibacter molinativorax]